ncbi:protein of unknown function [Caballeronia sp. S22]
MSIWASVDEPDDRRRMNAAIYVKNLECQSVWSAILLGVSFRSLWRICFCNVLCWRDRVSSVFEKCVW